MSAEQRMVDLFNKKYGSIVNIVAHNTKSHSYADIIFDGSIKNLNYRFILEAKKYNKYNIANYSKQLFAEILMNKFNSNNINNYGGVAEYGIFFNYNNLKTDKIYTFLQTNINSSDWDLFGTTFGINYVFLFDEIKKCLYYTSWSGFLVGFTAIKY